MRLTSTAMCAVGVGFLGLSACGLISSDIAKVSFSLPSDTIKFDTASAHLPAGNTVAVPCGDGQVVADCCHPPAGLPTVDCDATPILCPPETNVCTAEITVSQTTLVDLSTVDPRLATAKSLANVNIKQISYTVDSNSLNTDLPPASIYLAPQGVTDPRDGSAKKFGKVPSIPAGMTPKGNVILEPDAVATFSFFTRDLSMPFNLIVKATLDVASGSPIPNGAVQITVTGKLEASP